MLMQAQNPPLVSIVTPAYNEEQYLSECIESVLSQTYQNWDYTIIDNCSTDATLSIAQKYAAVDSRIRVFSNPSLVPAVANLNVSVRYISPDCKYCKVILADDWMYPECLARMVELMEDSPSIGLVGAYGLAEEWVVWMGLPYPSRFISGREVCRQRLLGGPYVFGSETSVLYRADLIRSRDPFYDEASAHPDSEICFELLKAADFGFVHQVLTFSRVRAGSLLTESRKLNTLAASMLREVVTYGPFYLTTDEYTTRLNQLTSKYYDVLARGVLQRREREFWQFHKGQLHELGVAYSGARVAASLAKLVFRAIVRRPAAMNGQVEWGL